MSVEDRRARLARRHRLAPEARATDVVEAARSLVCLHATTPSSVYLSAWARVDGVSPLSGKEVSVPYIGSPAGLYEGEWYGNFELGQYERRIGAVEHAVAELHGEPAKDRRPVEERAAVVIARVARGDAP